MLAVHEALYTTLLLLVIGLTLSAFFLLATGRGVGGVFRSTYILTIGAAVAQTVVGLVLVADGSRPASSFHYLYGVALIVFTAAGYVFAVRSEDTRRETLILGIASAAAVGLILRAVATAHG